MAFTSLRPFPIPPMVGGLFDQVPANEIPDQFGSTGRNITFQNTVIRKRVSFDVFGAALSGTVQRIFDFFTLNRSQFTMAAGTAGVWSFDDAGGTWTQRSTAAGSANIVPWFEIFNGILVTTDGINLPRSWDGIAATMSVLTGTPPTTARALLGLTSHLFAVYTTSPFRIQWCDFNNINQWASGDAAIVDLLDSDDPIVGVSRIGDFGVLLRRWSIWLIASAPAPAFYQFDKRDDRRGAIAAGSIQAVPGGTIYLSDTGFYMFDGVQSKPVAESLRKTVTKSLNYGALGTIVSGLDLAVGEYWCALPTSGATTPNLVLVYNFLDGYVTLHDYTVDGLGWRLNKPTPLRFSDLPNGFNTYTFHFDETTALAGSPILCAAKTAQVLKPALSKQDVTIISPLTYGPVNATVTTKLRDLGYPGYKKVDRIQLILEEQPANTTLTVQLGTSDNGQTVDYGPMYTVTPPVSGGSSGDVWLDTDERPAARYFAVLLANILTNQDIGIKSIVLWWRPRGAMA